MNTTSTAEQSAVAVFEDEFVIIPETKISETHTEPAFAVSKYLAAVIDGKAVSRRDLVPANNINYADARKAAADAGYQLMTLTQSQALALHVASVAANWTGGEVGQGSLIQGIHKGRVREPQDGNFAAPGDERREFALADGSIVFDVAGNLYTWLFDNVQGDADGLIAAPFAEDSPVVTAPYERMTKGMGWRPRAGADWSGSALVRGGYWSSGERAGVFRLNYGWPDDEYGSVGFRCTKPAGV